MHGLELQKVENCATVVCIKIAKAGKHTAMKKITYL